MLREGLIGFHLKDLASSVRTAVRTCAVRQFGLTAVRANVG